MSNGLGRDRVGMASGRFERVVYLLNRLGQCQSIGLLLAVSKRTRYATFSLEGVMQALRPFQGIGRSPPRTQSTVIKLSTSPNGGLQAGRLGVTENVILDPEVHQDRRGSRRESPVERLGAVTELAEGRLDPRDQKANSFLTNVARAKAIQQSCSDEAQNSTGDQAGNLFHDCLSNDGYVNTRHSLARCKRRSVACWLTNRASAAGDSRAREATARAQRVRPPAHNHKFH